MIDVNLPFHKILELGENNLLYTVAGVGGFLFTKIGLSLIRCIISRRSNKNKLKKHQDNIRDVTKKVIQDTIKSHNIAITPISNYAPATLTTVDEIEVKTKKVP